MVQTHHRRRILARQQSSGFERPFRPFAFYELSNLAADATERRQQRFIRFANFMTEEFHDAKELFAGDDWKRERGVQTFG